MAEPGEPYLASSRYYRGRIVDLLRALPPAEALDLEQIEQRLTAEVGAEAIDPAWLRNRVDGLVRDGLVEKETPSGTPRYRLAR